MNNLKVVQEPTTLCDQVCFVTPRLVVVIRRKTEELLKCKALTLFQDSVNECKITSLVRRRENRSTRFTRLLSSDGKRLFAFDIDKASVAWSSGTDIPMAGARIIRANPKGIELSQSEMELEPDRLACLLRQV